MSYSELKELKRILFQLQTVSDKLKAMDNPNYVMALGTTEFYQALGAFEAFVRDKT